MLRRWDLELNDKNSFYRFPNQNNSCMHITMPAGILRRDWLENATYMGKFEINNKSCYGYTKVDFIDYYADVETCEPVRWWFHGMKAGFDTVKYLPNRAIPNATWFQPPASWIKGVSCKNESVTATYRGSTSG